MVASRQAKLHAARITRQLHRDYPDARCALSFRSPLELLIATILSAQCTDKRVNVVTETLFKKYRTAEDYARAKPDALERDIQSTGFFRNKAKNIRGCCQRLVDQHDGQVPRTLEELVELPGVGRKTANVVLGTAFGLAVGVVVDTHVGRLSRRLGLSEQKDPVKLERELMQLLPKKEWIDFSHLMIHHGRAVCTARRPQCDACSLARWCPRNGVAQPTSRRRASNRAIR